MKTGVELIAIERNEKQITKHGFTAEHHAKHPEWYADNQLIYASQILLTKSIARDRIIKYSLYPKNWNIEWFNNLCNRPYQERLIIASAMIAAEWDRLDYLQNKKP